MAEQVLKSDRLQDQRKGEYEADELKNEALDVIMSSLLFADMLGYDVAVELEAKLLKTMERLNIPA